MHLIDLKVDWERFTNDIKIMALGAIKEKSVSLYGSW